MRAAARPPVRRWPWIVGAAVVVLAVVIAAVLYYSNQSVPADPTADPTASVEPSASASAGVDQDPTGCLGGEARDAAMVIAAQEAAPRTSNGAVEVAAAFTRWIQQFPYPPAGEAATIGKNVLASDSFTDDLAAYLAAEPDLSGGVVEQGSPFYMSTIPGVYHLESASNDQVEVTLGTGFVIDDVLSPNLRSSITVMLLWENGAWRVAQADGERTTEDLYSIGRPFTEGC